MKISEIITEANYGRYWCSTDKRWKYRKGPKQSRTVKEDFNTEDMVDYAGLKLHLVKDSDGLAVRAFDATGTKTLGYVEFFFNESGELDPQDVTVLEKYRGQGIAKIMYDYVRDLGYTIIRSWDQTPDGKAFWDKHQGEDARIWEELEENFADGKKPGRKGLSKRVGIPQQATLAQLEKIAKSSAGERRRMAQWQLNMRRGKARKNK